MNIDINWTKEQVIQYLQKENLKNKNKIINKFLDEEIDGEAFFLLSEGFFRELNIKNSNDKEIMKALIEKGENNLLKTKTNITEDKIYIQIFQNNLDKIWTSLNEKLEHLKLGEKLKYIKYLLIAEPLPSKESQILPYIKKVFSNLEEDEEDEDAFTKIETEWKNFKNMDSNTFNEKCKMWFNEEIDMIKLKIIIELIKQKYSQERNEEESILDQGNENFIENKPISSEGNNINAINDNFKLYSLIETYEFRTSQGLHSKGLLNPIEEFKSICIDFNIRYNDDCNEIHYEDAKTIKLASFMIWGSKEGLTKFFNENRIESINKYFSKNEKKAGIYLGINKDNISYLIIWPGEYSYDYSNINQPNNNLLLTLLRYGFSFSNYSILCLSDEEISNFNYIGYKIYEEKSGLKSTAGSANKNIVIKKTFKIDKPKNLKEEIKNKFNNIKIVNFKIRYNYILFYEKKSNEIKEYICLYEISQIRNRTELSLLKINEIMEAGGKKEIYDYFPQYYTKDLKIIKNNVTKKIKIDFRGHFIEEFDGLYDYDPISDTLIICKEEIDTSNEINRKVGLYFNDGKSKTLYWSSFLDNSSKLHKISLIPHDISIKKQNILIFIDQEIFAFLTDNNDIYTNNIQLANDFVFTEFDEFQFIVYIDFLLILHYENDNKWLGKVYSLNMDDKSFFNKIAQFNIEADKSSLFSFYEITNKKYLIAINLKQNKANILYWEINSKLSNKTIEFQKIISKNTPNLTISSGNCVVNYLYHCFEKYCLVGSIEYIRGTYSMQLKVFTGQNKLNSVPSFKNYIKNLFSNCEKKKGFKFSDVHFEFFDECSYGKKNTSLGNILLKVLEATPIQIAKISLNKFEIMSNWDSIDAIIERRENSLEQKNINFEEYTNIINFGIKDSVLNFYKLPVIVICCFGSQSVGKSTFLNELTGSIFNVSGMRCTEGIWMSIKIFSSLDEDNSTNIECERKCTICNDKKCCLYIEHLNYCICNDCKCGKDCELKGNPNCEKICYFEKNHEQLIECAFENCECKCKCINSCKCSNHIESHNHICKKCYNNNIECNCNCGCRHLCKIPVLKHDFIVVSLDFEGLGTFERRAEQDIQMALVGSSLGNNIIFRMDKTFDNVLIHFLNKLSSASRNIGTLDIKNYFGGALCLSPKDIDRTESDNLKNDIIEKLEGFVISWNQENDQYNNEIQTETQNKKNKLFGLFQMWIVSPTPNIHSDEFYNTLRESLNKDIIEDSLIFHRHPIYNTGNEFLINMKHFLSVVYFRRYDLLVDYQEQMLDEYIRTNKEQIYEICGILDKKVTLDNQNNNIKNVTDLYIKPENLKNLEIDVINKQKFEVKNELIINNISNISSNNISVGIFIIEKYNIQVILSKNIQSDYSLEIKNLNDFGLILKVPNQIKNEITIDKICENLFKIWKEICNRIGLNEKDTTIIFKDFIHAIIVRRNQNLSKWLDEITIKYPKLKNKYEEIKYNSPLNIIWTICEEPKCKSCFNHCCLLNGHQSEHKCFYDDHKCKKKCEICGINKCKEDNCEHICTLEMSHPGIHFCKHFHPCNESCYLKELTNGCKGNCILEYGHEKNGVKHFCGLAKHLCKTQCDFNQKEGCIFQCKYEYNHSGNHICEGNHICGDDCSKILNEGCGKKCKLPLFHIESQHDCKKIHRCLGICIYENDSINCRRQCCLNDGHQPSPHLCEIKNGHKCNKDCNYITKANNCGGRCTLPIPHNNPDIHFCDNTHKCRGICVLRDKSRQCNVICKETYPHPHGGNCICNLEKHICKERCRINNNCNRLCILEVGHLGEHLCGECNCKMHCKYIGSRNCHENCNLKAGHKGDCICNSNDHKCNKECKYTRKSTTNTCEGFCNLPPHEGNEHQCGRQKNEHICIEKCFYFGKANNCGEDCKLEVEHSGNHNCKKNHKCRERCYLDEKSRTCRHYCNKNYGHNDAIHICELNPQQHICNKNCSFKDYSRNETCDRNCSLSAEPETHICKCSKTIEQHKCYGKCSIEGCNNDCNLQPRHSNEHICSISREQHNCSNKCQFYVMRNNKKEICNGSCKYKLGGHPGNCKCLSNSHLCNIQCILDSYTNCKGFCEEIESTQHSEHKCKGTHKCQQDCKFYRDFNSIRGKCDNCKKKCSLDYGHPGVCRCDSLIKHPCNQNCEYYGIDDEHAGGCNKDCDLEYGHDSTIPHKCSSNYHTCKKKCEIGGCNNKCGHVFNHHKVSNLKCNNTSCNNQICQLRNGDGHLCGISHNCSNDCEEEGWCHIDSNLKTVEETYSTEFGEVIKYQKIKEQNAKKDKCQIQIPPNKKSHEPIKCSCKKSHNCNFQCIQCMYYCTEIYGHSSNHKCDHGNIINSLIYISDSAENNNSYASIALDKKNYKFKQGEKVQIFFCDKYCKEQGRGHTHIFESKKKLNICEDIKEIKYDGNIYIYQCKCPYFWKNILKFESKLISQDEFKSFCFCNWKCKYQNHQMPEYCKLPLWHKEENITKIPKGIYGKWIYEGHIFACDHPKGIYNIFLVDHSGSMSSSSANPSNPIIKKKMDNMMGAAIQAIVGYCNIRAKESPKDKCAIFGFDDKVVDVFINKDINLFACENENDNYALNECLNKLKPDGWTEFKGAFERAFNLINSNQFDRNELVPIIIILTDGIDYGKDQTISYIEKVSYYI